MIIIFTGETPGRVEKKVMQDAKEEVKAVSSVVRDPAQFV